jgi:hypothetical protein
MAEKDVVAAQKRFIEGLGGACYLVNQSRGKTRSYTDPGFSDTVLFVGGRIIFNETKEDYNTPSEDQLAFQYHVVRNGGLYVVSHSADELEGIGRTLGLWR